MKTLDLKNYKLHNTTVFTGRIQGQKVRKDLNLNIIDDNDENVEIIIPPDTTTFNPSFFLGLLFDSIQKLGFENFKQKYTLKISTRDPQLYNIIKSNIDDGYRNALNSIKGLTGLNV